MQKFVDLLWAKLCLGLLMVAFLSPIQMNAQYDGAFEQHLYNKGLRAEHEAYLRELSLLPTDSLQFLRARFELHYNNDSLFLQSFKSLKPRFQSQLTERASIYFLHAASKNRDQWFSQQIELFSPSAETSMMKVYRAGQSPQSFSAHDFPEELETSFLRMQKFDSRSPAVSAMLSAVVPGLGRVYSGRPKSFANTFATVVMFGAQSAESIHRLGIKNPLSIVMLTGFTTFYIGNIYGSYKDLKKVKKETQTQFYYDASDHYRAGMVSRSH
jgi:hypothetical protein